jgi:hypothetical protein
LNHFTRGLCQTCYARRLRKQHRYKRRVCRLCREEFSEFAEMYNSARTLAGGRIIAGSSTMVNAMADREITLESLVTFQLGEMGEGIALVLAYATSQEKLGKGEMESFAIGMTREKAGELGRALVEIAGKAPGAGGPRRREH